MNGIIIVLGFLFGISSVHAWGDHGHQLMSTMIKLRAKDNMKGAVPYFQIERVEHLMRIWRATGGLPIKHAYASTFNFGPSIPSYTRASTDAQSIGMERTWADFMKDSLHVYRVPFDFHNPDANVTNWGVGKFDGVPGQLEFLYNSLIRQKDMGKPKKGYGLEYAFTLDSYLMQLFQFLHFIGDIHQPFHTIGLKGGRFDAPQYDEGGELLKLTDKSENPLLKDITSKLGNGLSLHKIWDLLLWNEDTEDMMPRVQSCSGYCEEYSKHMDNNILVQDAQNLVDDHPCDKIDVETLEASFEKIVKDSYDYAKTTAYNPVQEIHLTDESVKLDLSDDYVKNSHGDALKMVALAACRAERRLHKILDVMPYLTMVEDMTKYLRRHTKNNKLQLGEMVFPQ